MTGRRRSSLFVIAGSGANSLIVGAQSLILIPLYLRVVGERLYGAWLGSGDLLNWMLVSDLGITNLMIQRVGAAHAEGDHRAEGAWFATSTAVVAAICAALAAAGVGLAFLIPRLFGVEGAGAGALRDTFAVASVSTSVTVLNSSFYAYARGVQRTGLLAGAAVAATLAAFAASLAGALLGYGLGAIALGFAVRGAVTLGGMVVFAAREVRPEVRAALRLDRGVLRELRWTVPATGLAGFAYAAMNQSELLVISLLVGPEAAALYMLNRKAMELGRSVADGVTFGSFGGFAHLVASDGRTRAMAVYRELISVRTTLSVGMAAAFVALNQSFVTVWVGPGRYAGLALTFLIGMQAIVSGNAFLVNYLYRASGAVVRSSLLLVAESAARVALMAALVKGIGLIGVPLAGIATAVLFLAVTHARLRAFLAGFAAPGKPIAPGYWAACAAVLGAGAVLGSRFSAAHWGYVLAAGAVLSAAGFAGLAVSNAYLRRYPAAVWSRLAGARGAAG